MYSVFYKRPTGETVRINSEFQPKISSPYVGLINCEVDGYKILVPSNDFCLEFSRDKSDKYTRDMEELLHG